MVTILVNGRRYLRMCLFCLFANVYLIFHFVFSHYLICYAHEAYTKIF